MALDRALAKRQREEQKKQAKQQKEEEKRENKKWRDEVTDKKSEQKSQAEDRRLEELRKRQEKRELLEQEEQEMEQMGSKKKEQFQNKKFTQAQISLNQQKALMGVDFSDSSDESDEDPNPNHQQNDFQVAKNVEEALDMLNVKEDLHPEKRFKAAFEAYCAKREPVLKLENSGSKRSQRMQIMRKEFDKHPDNPFNKANLKH